MRFRIPEIVLGMLFATSLFALGVLTASLQPPPQMGQQQAASENGGHDGKREIGEGFWQRALTDPTAFFTLIIAAFTTVLGVSTILLWRATGKLASGAERTAERQLRAYLAVTGARVKIENDTAKISIRVSNGGQTPAYDVSAFLMVTALPSAFLVVTARPKAPNFWKPLDKNLVNAILAPGGHFDPTGEIYFGQEVREKAIAGETIVFVWGEFIYKDIFRRKDRHLRYRGRLTYDGEWGVSPEPEGNEAD